MTQRLFDLLLETACDFGLIQPFINRLINRSLQLFILSDDRAVSRLNLLLPHHRKRMAHFFFDKGRLARA